MSHLERVEVFALNVFDERDLEHPVVRNVAHDGRDLAQTGDRAGAQTPFAGDEQIALALGAQQDRLNHAVCADRLRQLFDRPA